MCETLLNQLLNNHLNLDEFYNWLRAPNNDPKINTKYKCTRPEFITYFLNFIHDETNSEKTDNSEINRSQSCPLNLSGDSPTTSTPSFKKGASEGHLSLLSPIYKQEHSFGTPKGRSLCLGDFIVSRNVSSSKKKRRIKPLSLSGCKNVDFQNSFSFEGGELEELPCERGALFDVLPKKESFSGGFKEVRKLMGGEVKVTLDEVTLRESLNGVVDVYVVLLEEGYVLNLTNEVYFFVCLLLKKQSWDLGVVKLGDITGNSLFGSFHNLVYFACKSLEKLVGVLENYDNSTIRLLCDNERLKHFSPKLVEHLSKIVKPDRIIELEKSQENICFNLDTDNRQNFPNDPSFHAFRKQRDLFYEILRIWELHHLSPSFDFTINLGPKIKTLHYLSREPTNFINFCRLFKAQLLTSCKNVDSGELHTSLDVDAQKLSKLQSRCVRKGTCQGLNSLPVFNDWEEFFKDFIVTGGHYVFNKHLGDALIEEISELNETNFGSADFDDETDDGVDPVTKKTYQKCVKDLGILAKFQGLLDSLPYKTDQSYADNLQMAHLKLRRQVHPNFDVKTLLNNSIRRRSVILCVPWLVKYLSMLDNLTLKLPYYTQLTVSLFWLYKNINWTPSANTYLIKFTLGWLFDLPHFPHCDYMELDDTCQAFDDDSTVHRFALDELELVDQDILYLCCPYLEEIKRLLTVGAPHTVSLKKITPVTALQSSDDVASKKLQVQLEEAFFNGQPLSTRKTVEFVSERVASACVKHLCYSLVPEKKHQAALDFKKLITLDENLKPDEQKLALKAKAAEYSATCLQQLKRECDDEIVRISSEKIEKAVDALSSVDVLSKTKQVTVALTKKYCLERVRKWIESHVIMGVFMKDFNEVIQKAMNWDGKSQKATFALPSGGNKLNHDDDVTSAAHLVEKYRSLTIDALERKAVTSQDVEILLDETIKSVNDRCDFNQAILSSVCMQLLDLILVLFARDWRIPSQGEVLVKAGVIWRLFHNDDLFKTLICPRNVKIFSESSDKVATWHAFGEFCVHLIRNGFLNRGTFESQCAGIFRTDWDEENLKLITGFLKSFTDLYKKVGGDASDFTFLLDFLSDYCEDLA